jgi:hypothetical protein
MAITFTPISPERSEEVIRFLSKVFDIKKLPPNLYPETQNWKYFAPHPWWPTTRSYVLESGNEIAAHGCIAPIRFTLNGSILESMVIIDWASGKLVPGAGLLVYRRCMEVQTNEVQEAGVHRNAAQKTSLLAIGGSSDTVRILPEVHWFKPQADFKWYARSLKPWRRFLRSNRGGKDLLKLLRNAQWKLAHSLPQTGHWTCRTARTNDPVFTPAGDFVPILRTKEWIDYLRNCPAAKCSLWTLEHKGTPSGHALVANLARSARIADFALQGKTNTETTTQAFSALLRSLAADSQNIEVVAASTLTQDISAFENCGMKHRRNSPVLLADPQKIFPPELKIEIKPMLGDGFYLHDPSQPFQL